MKSTLVDEGPFFPSTTHASSVRNADVFLETRLTEAILLELFLRTTMKFNGLQMLLSPAPWNQQKPSCGLQSLQCCFLSKLLNLCDIAEASPIMTPILLLWFFFKFSKRCFFISVDLFYKEQDHVFPLTWSTPSRTSSGVWIFCQEIISTAQHAGISQVSCLPSINTH